VYLHLKQQGHNVNTFSPGLSLLFSFEVRPLGVGQVRYAIETEIGVLRSMPKKLFVNALININILLHIVIR